MFSSKIRPKTNSDIEASLCRVLELRRDGPSRFKELLCVGEANPPNVNIAAANRPHSDLDFALYILENILLIIPDKINEGYQAEAIHDTILRCIHPHNDIQTRKIGMRCFFIWYQSVCVEYENEVKISEALMKQLDTTFSVLVPYFPVPSPSDQRVFTSSEKVLYEICNAVGGPYVPVHAEKINAVGTSQLRQSFLERLLYGVVKEVERIHWPADSKIMHRKCLQMLLDKVRELYMSAYFPEPLPTLDLYNYTQSILPQPPQFSTPYSPLSINDPIVMCRAAVVHWIAGYALGYAHLTDSLSNNATPNNRYNSPQVGDPRAQLPPNYDLMRAVLFSKKRNVNLVLSILKEGLMLPLQCSKVMSRVFRIIREWVLLVELRPFMEEPSSSEHETAAGLETSLVALTEILLTFYFSPYLPIEQEKLSTAQEVNQRIQGLLRILINSPRLTHLPYSRKLWITLLTGIRLVVERIMPCSPPALGVDLPQQYACMVATSLLYTLLLAWVMATGLNRLSIPDAMWDSLVETLQARTRWIDVIDQWSQVMAGITRALGLHCFGIDLQDPPLQRLSEQKMKKMAGQSRTQLTSDKSDKITESADGGQLTANGHQFDFIGASPVATTPVDGNSIKTAMTSLEVSPAMGQRSRVSTSVSVTYPIQQPVNGVYLNVNTGEGGDYNRADTVSLEGSASLDSTSLVLSATGVSSEGGPRGSVMFGVDRESITPSPPPSVADEDNDPTSFHDLADLTRLDEIGDPLSPAACADGLSYAETWTVVWKRMLGSLGHVDEMKEPNIHAKAVEVFVSVAEMLIKIRENQGVSVDGVACEPPTLIPPINCVIPYLLHAAQPDTKRFNSSCSAALRCLCKIYLRRPVDTPICLEHLAHFCRLMHSALHSNPNITNCQLILQDVVPQVFYIGAERMETNCNAPVLNSTCRILIRDCFSASRSILESDNVEHNQASQFVACLSLITACQSPNSSYVCTDSSNITSHELYLSCHKALITAFNGTRLDGVSKGICLSALCCLLYLMHKLSHANSAIALELQHVIVQTIRDGPAQFALMTVQCVSALIGVADKNTAEKIIEVLIERLNRALNHHSKSGDKHGDTVLVNRLLCEIGEWCLSYMPEDVLPAVQALVAAADCHTHSVQSSCLLALTMLTRGFRQFPPTPFSMAHLSSSFTNHTFVGATSNHVLWSVQQETTNDSCVFSSTHIGGKVQWTLSPVEDSSREKEAKAERVDSDARAWLLAEEAGVPHADADDVSEHAPDALQAMCSHIAATSKECLPHPAFPHVIPETSSKDENLITTSIAELRRAEIPELKHNQDECASTSRQPVDTWRELIASVGLIAWEQQKQVRGKSCNHKDLSRLQRELVHLHKQNGRESHKVAVIYVAPGQEDKESILSNNSASTAFEDFVAALGWEVDIATHSGYSGGLSAKEEACTSPYFACAAYEILFHVSTRLPIGEQCDTRKRLRHLGNDEVVVVWSEHNRDYRKNIIATEFADVLIVIYPLADGLCRISVSGAHECVGPLFDGCVIPTVYLGALLRTTIVNCARAKRHSLSGWNDMHEQRYITIKQIMNHFANPAPFANTLRSVYSPTQQVTSVVPGRVDSKTIVNALDPGEIVMV